MDELLHAAGLTGYKDILQCLEKVFIDLGVDTFEKLENLPTLRNGRTRICGNHDVYKLIADVKDGLYIILENVVAIDQLSFDEEE